MGVFAGWRAIGACILLMCNHFQENVIRINTKWRVIGQCMKREWRDEKFIQGFGNKQESSYGGSNGAAVPCSRFLVGLVVRPFRAAGSLWD